MLINFFEVMFCSKHFGNFKLTGTDYIRSFCQVFFKGVDAIGLLREIHNRKRIMFKSWLCCSSEQVSLFNSKIKSLDDILSLKA